jgi:hypothetical protein
MSTKRAVIVLCFILASIVAGIAAVANRGADGVARVFGQWLANPGSGEASAITPRIVPGDGPPAVTVTDRVVVAGVKRLGINLGGRSQYDAAQTIKNIIPNPGFEAGLYGSMIHAEGGATGDRIPQAYWVTEWNHDEYGIGQPEGFWDGGEYEIVFGPAKGRRGSIKRFAIENNRNVFYLDSDGVAPKENDTFIVRQQLAGLAAGPRMNETSVDTAEVRPGSPGTQSLHLGPGGVWNLFLDSYWRDGDTTAGKLLVIDGPWILSFWAKGEGSGSRLRARFQREGEATFIDESIALSPEWKEYTLSFDASPGVDRRDGYSEADYHALLVLSFSTESGTAWIDDASLQRSDYTNPTVFIDPLVEKFRELRPGVLRYWGQQLGDTLDNQLAEPWARKQVGFSPRYRAASDFCFSFHEFLELCELVEAEPWYVIPPTFTPEDCAGLIEYLAAPADSGHAYAERRAAMGRAAPWTERFPQIHLEFGNEMWGGASGNDPFFGASALYGDRLGSIAGDRFALMRSSPYFAPETFNLIIGGQYYFPGRQEEITRSSSAHDAVALAPYFGELGTYDTPEDRYYPLFARAFEDVVSGKVKASRDIVTSGGQSTSLAVYEINFHTTGGDIPSGVRNDFVTGGSGALALPLYMLVYLREFGVREQCAFSTLQYSFDMSNRNYVRLWGLLRDIAATGRKRPTWLGLELVNRVIGGDMVETLQSGSIPMRAQPPLNGVEREITIPLIESFAFRDGDQWGLILFNLGLDKSETVEIRLPEDPAGNVQVFRIAPGSLSDDNEDSTTVTIEPVVTESFGNPAEIELPPHSITGLTWRTN